MACARGCCETQREHYLSVSISAVATPTSRPETAASVLREKRWDKDMPAYKRLRDSGVQPQRIDGSHRLEQEATTQTEVERGRKMAGGGARFQEVSDAYQSGNLAEVI